MNRKMTAEEFIALRRESPEFQRALENVRHVAGVDQCDDSVTDSGARSAALRDAANALELLPPMLRAQYVATLRLYADEPWRLSNG